MPTVTTTRSPSIGATASLTERALVAGVALLLGVSLVYFAGFSHIPEVHNAAHDTRHSAAFPCH